MELRAVRIVESQDLKAVFYQKLQLSEGEINRNRKLPAQPLLKRMLLFTWSPVDPPRRQNGNTQGLDLTAHRASLTDVFRTHSSLQA